MSARIVVAVASCILTGCGGGGGGSEPTPTQQSTKYQISGTVSGSRGPVVLQLNADESVSVSAAGPFTFATQLSSGAAYSVAVISTPAGQQCSVDAGSGVATAAVGNVQVACSDTPQTTFAVTGTVAGLSGTVRLELNETQIAVSSNGAFSFPQQLLTGTAYEVTVSQQPLQQFCRLSSAAGTIGTSNPNVVVTCEPAYLIGVTFAGLQGDMVVSNNGTETATISSGGFGTASGTMYFGSRLPSGNAYRIAIDSQPAGQQCTLSGASGLVASSDVLASITCHAVVQSFTVGGTVSGLNGTLVLRNNGSNDLSVSTNGAFTFGTPSPAGLAYNVAIATQPQGQQCAVTGGNGTVNGTVVSVVVTCTTLTPHTLGGRVIGVGNSVVLRNNGGNALTIGNDGSFTFTNPLLAGASYAVTASSADTNQKCLVSAGSGVMPDANVNNVSVVCNSKRDTRFAYVVNRSNGQGGSGYISQYSVGTSASLSPLAPATIAAGVSPRFMVVDPAGRFAYVQALDPAMPAASATRFWQFTIGPGGALTPMSVASIDTGGPLASPTINPSATYLYASRDGDVLRFAIGAGGELQAPVVQNLVSSGSLGGTIALDRAGEHAYVVGSDNAGNIAIYQFRVENDGSLSSLSPAAVGTSVPFGGALASDPFDRTVYGVDEVFGRILQLRRAPNGTLTQQTPAFIYNATLFPGHIGIEPFGAFAYTSAPGSISQFVVDSSGALTVNAVDSTRPDSQETFTSMAVDFAGAYVYVTSSLNTDKWIHQYTVNADGTLTRVVSGSIAAGADPVQIVVAP